MPVYKRYYGRQLDRDDPNWDRATWYINKRFRGKLIHRAIPEAITEEDALKIEADIVRELYETGTVGTQRVFEAQLRRKKARKFEYVYVMESQGFYKIGKTTDLQSRLKALHKVVVPFESSLVLAVQVANSSKTERELHERFKDKRTAGEWFHLAPSEVAILKKELLNCG